MKEITILQNALLIYGTGGAVSDSSIKGFGVSTPLLGVQNFADRGGKGASEMGSYPMVDHDPEKILNYLRNYYFLYDIARQYTRDLSDSLGKKKIISDSTKTFLKSEKIRLDDCRRYIWDQIPSPKSPVQDGITIVGAMDYHLSRSGNKELIYDFNSKINLDKPF